MSDRIEEIKARCELAKKVMTVLRDLDDIRGEQTIRSAAADILDNCGKDLEFLLGEIERLESGVTMFSDELDLAKMETIRLRDEINRLNNALDATETARKNLQEWRAEDVERLTAEVEEYHAWQLCTKAGLAKTALTQEMKNSLTGLLFSFRRC